MYLLFGGALQLVELLADSKTASSAGDQGLESVEVVHVGASSSALEGLGSLGFGPLGSQTEFLGGLLHGVGAGTTLDVDDVISEENTLEVHDLALDAMLGTIQDHAVGIDDVDDHANLALELATVDLDDAANLDKTSEERLDQQQGKTSGQQKNVKQSKTTRISTSSVFYAPSFFAKQIGLSAIDTQHNKISRVSHSPTRDARKKQRRQQIMTSKPSKSNSITKKS